MIMEIVYKYISISSPCPNILLGTALSSFTVCPGENTVTVEALYISVLMQYLAQCLKEKLLNRKCSEKRTRF